MSEAQAKSEPRPTRLQLIREKGKGAKPSIPKRGAQLLDIGLLIEDPQNERKTFRNMEGLIETVKSMGVIEPLTVTAHESGSYMIVTGHRRFRAAQAAGVQQLRVVITDPEEQQARRRKSIVSNVQREDVPPVELAEALQSLLDEDPSIKTQRDLAKFIGKRESWVSDMLRILTLPAKLQEELRTSEAPVPYDAVMRISRVDDGKLQQRLVKDVLDGRSNRDIREQIDRAKNKPPVAKNGTKTDRGNVGESAAKTRRKTFSVETENAAIQVTFKNGPASKRAAIQALEDALRSLKAG